MAWTDRLKEAAYTSPSGTRRVFLYENVSHVIEKKTTAFEFPDADGTFIQDTGSSGRRFPLTIFLSGADYDIEAEAFMSSLAEQGPGILEHPIYGVVDVVPFGKISRRDDLKTAGNQAVIQVTFWQHIGVIYPSSQRDPITDATDSLAALSDATAQEFGGLLDFELPLDIANAVAQVDGYMDEAEELLDFVTGLTEEVVKEFTVIQKAIGRGVDIFIGGPVTLAFQVNLMISKIASGANDVKSKINAYLGRSDIILENVPGTNNELQTASLFAISHTAGAILSAVNAEYTTKTEALDTAVTLLEQLDKYTEWQETSSAPLGQVNDGTVYQQLQTTTTLAVAYLVQESFNLAQERSIVLDRNRTIIDVAAEVYGSVDDRLDLLISSNNLTGSEILELPRGKEIVYYL